MNKRTSIKANGYIQRDVWVNSSGQYGIRIDVGYGKIHSSCTGFLKEYPWANGDITITIKPRKVGKERGKK